jgi:hypothetical protein
MQVELPELASEISCRPPFRPTGLEQPPLETISMKSVSVVR